MYINQKMCGRHERSWEKGNKQQYCWLTKPQTHSTLHTSYNRKLVHLQFGTKNSLILPQFRICWTYECPNTSWHVSYSPNFYKLKPEGDCIDNHAEYDKQVLLKANIAKKVITSMNFTLLGTHCQKDRKRKTKLQRWWYNKDLILWIPFSWCLFL